MFAKWKVYFEENNNQGTTPEDFLRSKGYEAVGLFQYDLHKIVGELSDDADIENLEQFEISFITDNEALELAQSIDSGAKLENGKIFFTPIEL